MEDIRTYQIEEDDRDDERVEFNASGAPIKGDDEVPFHIPRD
jgi:hypothetical protein